MAIAKVIEISAESEQGFEDAIRQGIEGAGKTVRNMRSAWIKEQEVVVENNRAARYRVMMKITFMVE
jgi:flavin-binding protein dodecin